MATAWAAAAAVATDTPHDMSISRNEIGAVVLAALAVPGVVTRVAHAEGAPEHGVFGLKYLRYQDSQPGFKRITVNAPSAYVLAPLGSSWSVEASGVVDSLSGATPRYHTAVSGASRMSDERKAGDMKLTRYFSRSSYSVGASHSSENDYKSSAVSLDGNWSTEDNNTSFNLGVGYSADKINPTGYPDIDERKRTRELLLGITQVWSSTDLVQFNVTYSSGKGYYSDPYKLLDERPRERRQTALLWRWNHHFEPLGSTLRTSYRWYGDSFKVKAHTVQAEWVVPVTPRFTVTPVLRYASQSAAAFYFDPVYDPTIGEPYPNGYDVNNPPRYSSADQRLSAFGAVTMGLKAELRLDELWQVDGKVEAYEQRGSWRIGGKGSPGLAPFRAYFYQLGASRRF